MNKIQIYINIFYIRKKFVRQEIKTRSENFILEVLQQHETKYSRDYANISMYSCHTTK